jgi:hypothetical protein
VTAQTFENIAAALESCFTIIALFVGAYWTWHLFVRKREDYPRARISHTVRVIAGEGRVKLVRLAFVIENNGTVLLPLAKIEIKVQQLKPLPVAWMAALHNAGAVGRADHELDWPVLFEDAVDCSAYELEPGEREDLQFDLELSCTVKLVQVYSHMPNRAKVKRGIGWNCTSIHALKEEEDHGEVVVEGKLEEGLGQSSPGAQEGLGEDKSGA